MLDICLPVDPLEFPVKVEFYSTNSKKYMYVSNIDGLVSYLDSIFLSRPYTNIIKRLEQTLF